MANKEQLTNQARALGLEVNDQMTKAQIEEIILQSKEASPEGTTEEEAAEVFNREDLEKLAPKVPEGEIVAETKKLADKTILEDGEAFAERLLREADKKTRVHKWGYQVTIIPRNPAKWLRNGTVEEVQHDPFVQEFTSDSDMTRSEEIVAAYRQRVIIGDLENPFGSANPAPAGTWRRATGKKLGKNADYVKESDRVNRGWTDEQRDQYNSGKMKTKDTATVRGNYS